MLAEQERIGGDDHILNAYDERTVCDWYARGGEHCRQVHEAIVGQGQVDIRHVQADELCVKTVKLHEERKKKAKKLNL